MSKILIVNSSFRPKSNSTLLASRVAAGAGRNGHDVTPVDISRLRISPCMGCLLCMQPGSAFCANRDDMYPFYPLIRDADTIIFATPVYWFNMSGQIKQFIDRCYAVAVNPDPALPSPFAAKRIGAVLVYGAEDPFDAGAVNALRCFQDICVYTGAQWLGAVYGSAGNPGEIAANTALLEKAEQFGMGL